MMSYKIGKFIQGASYTYILILRYGFPQFNAIILGKETKLKC